MKIEKSESTLSVIGSNTNISSMGINENSSKLFSMLVDSLYTDKYGAVVRELSSNALDAHAECGKEDVPFEIHLPTQFKEEFRIKDFGGGMSKDIMINIFSNLLVSTKEDSNLCRGAYGIGSKSPFSLTDKFVVTSTHNNRETTIMFIREEKNTPHYILLGEKDVDKESSTEIYFDSPYDTVDLFKRAIENQLFLLPLKPKVFGLDEDIEYISTVDLGNLAIGEHVAYSMANKPDTKIYIAMGSIAHPLTLNDSLRKHMPSVENRSIVFNMPIGSVDVPPDRERVELTDKSVHNIISFWNDNKHLIEEYLLSQKKALSTDDTYKNYNKFRNIALSYSRNNFVDIDFVREHIDCSFTFRKDIIDLNAKFFGESVSVYDLKTQDKIMHYRNGCLTSDSVYFNVAKVLNEGCDFVICTSPTTKDQVHSQMKDQKIKEYYIIKCKKSSVDFYQKVLSVYREYMQYNGRVHIITSDKKTKNSLSTKTETKISGVYDTFTGENLTKNEVDTYTRSGNVVILKTSSNLEYIVAQLKHYIKKDIKCISMSKGRFSRYEDLSMQVDKGIIDEELAYSNILDFSDIIDSFRNSITFQPSSYKEKLTEYITNEIHSWWNENVECSGNKHFASILDSERKNVVLYSYISANRALIKAISDLKMDYKSEPLKSYIINGIIENKLNKYL